MIAGLLVSNAYAKDDWNTEKAKSLGMPLIPVGAEIICQSEMRSGFYWKNGEYTKATFENIKHILKKLEPANGCLGFDLNPDRNFISRNVYKRSIEDEETIHSSHEVCINHIVFGEEPSMVGGKCIESYVNEKDENWVVKISCKDASFVPDIVFTPNGIYHLNFFHENVSLKPKNGHKDSLLIEWGRCASISP